MKIKPLSESRLLKRFRAPAVPMPEFLAQRHKGTERKDTLRRIADGSFLVVVVLWFSLYPITVLFGTNAALVCCWLDVALAAIGLVCCALLRGKAVRK